MILGSEEDLFPSAESKTRWTDEGLSRAPEDRS